MSFSSILELIRTHLSLLVLALAVVISALAVIYTKHIGRTEFITLQKLEQQRDHLNEEWGRLLLEESTWAGPGRVEQQARLRLNMLVPTVDMTVVIKP
ncbi:MAG: cell division protein FtsL [Gammaproteobacteria bacterium]|nr:cell division protein FtsL [Gammaproteobacteria bacterium]MDH5591629.1 cell division protein FtsL [Gammaproteobacteria bacterium]